MYQSAIFDKHFSIFYYFNISVIPKGGPSEIDSRISVKEVVKENIFLLYIE